MEQAKGECIRERKIGDKSAKVDNKDKEKIDNQIEGKYGVLISVYTFLLIYSISASHGSIIHVDNDRMTSY